MKGKQYKHLSPATGNNSGGGRNIALLLEGDAEKRGSFQLLAGETGGKLRGAMCVQTTAGDGHWETWLEVAGLPALLV